ncbi:MAG: type IV pilus assembly protein PilM [bacterium]|nr:type IV pilus assembly protein PilM [bacterium]
MGFLQNLFKNQEDSVIGVDIGASSIKVVQLRKKGGKAILETYGELALGPYAGVEIGRATNLPAEKVAAALADVIKEANVTASTAVMSIAASSSLLSFIRMPDMDRKRLDDMIPIEARKYIPVPITEVAIDWLPIPKEENSFSSFEKPSIPGSGPKEKTIEIILVVIHNDVIARMTQISELARLATQYFEVEVFSSIRSVVDISTESHLLFDMGAGSTKLYIIERGILRSSHMVNRGSQDITLAISRSLGLPVGDAERVKRTVGISAEPDNKALAEVISLNLDYIFTETNRVIAAYQQKHRKNISKVILTGGGSLLKGFLDVARKRLETEVVMGDPFSKTEAPAFLEPVLRNAGPEFAVAIGAALRKLEEMS